MQIQPLSLSDLPLACALCKEVFLAFDAPDYPRQGIDFFLSYIAPDHLHSMMRQGQLRLYGAFENNALSGVLALRGFSHISLLFVRAESIGKALAVCSLVTPAKKSGRPKNTG